MQRQLDPEFAAYVRARQHTMLRAAYLVCGDVHLAEDLLQGAFVKLAANWPKVRTGSPDAYLRQILYRDAVSQWRRRRRETVGVPDFLRQQAAGFGGSEDVDGRVDLARYLARLTPKQRAVLVLRYFEDRTERETASVLGVSIGTVKSQTHVALARLRDVMPGVEAPAPRGGVR